MAYLTFTLYFLVFSWLITKSSFIRKTGIKKSVLIVLFTIKLLCGVLYGYIYSLPAFILASDTWQIYFESLKEYRVLLYDPARFFASLFANPDHLSYTGFSASSTSYWNNLKDNLLIKAEAVMNLLSGGYYYTNVVIYSFVTFYGSIAFFRTINELYTSKRIFKIITSFLLPSFLLWTSGLYKDGLLFLFMSLIIFQVNRWITERKSGWRRFSVIIISFAIIFMLRNYVAFLLMPALAGWLVSTVFPEKGILVFTFIYMVLVFFIVSSRYIHPQFDVPKVMASWQTGFMRLPARSAIPANKLDPSVMGLVKMHRRH